MGSRHRSTRAFRFTVVVSAVVFMLSVIIGWRAIDSFSRSKDATIAGFLRGELGSARQGVQDMVSSARALALQAYNDLSVSRVFVEPELDLLRFNAAVKQLDTYRELAYYANSIYAYDARKRMFYVAISKGSRTLYPLDQFFDREVATIVENLRGYSPFQVMARRIPNDTPAAPAMSYTDGFSLLYFDRLALDAGVENAIVVNMSASRLAERIRLSTAHTDIVLFVVGDDGTILSRTSGEENSPSQEAIVPASAIVTRAKGAGFESFRWSGVRYALSYSDADNFGWKYAAVALADSFAAGTSADPSRIALLAIALTVLTAIITSLIVWSLSPTVDSDPATKSSGSIFEIDENVRTLARTTILRAIVNRDAIEDEVIPLFAMVESEGETNSAAARHVVLFSGKHGDVNESDLDSLLVQFGHTDTVEFRPCRIGRTEWITVIRSSDATFAERSEGLSEAVFWITVSDVLADTNPFAEAVRQTVEASVRHFARSNTEADSQKPNSTAGIAEAGNSAMRSAILHRTLSAGDAKNTVELFDTLAAASATRGRTIYRELVNTFCAALYAAIEGFTHGKREPEAERAFELVNSIFQEGGAPSTLHEIPAAIEMVCGLSSARVKDRDAELCDRVDRIIETELSMKELCLKLVADRLGMTSDYVGRVYRRVTQKSVAKAIADRRVELACKLLKQTDLNVVEVAERIGVTDTSYFYRTFKQSTGVTPNEFRRNLRPAWTA